MERNIGSNCNNSLQFQAFATWKIFVKPGSQELTNLSSVRQELKKFHFKNTHPQTRQLVKNLIRQCQSSVSDDQATSPKRKKRTTTKKNSKSARSYFQFGPFFGDTSSSPVPFMKISTSFYTSGLLLENFNSHFVLVPTERRFHFTAFSNSYFSEKIERTSTGKPREDAIFFFLNSYSF